MTPSIGRQELVIRFVKLGASRTRANQIITTYGEKELERAMLDDGFARGLIAKTGGDKGGTEPPTNPPPGKND